MIMNPSSRNDTPGLAPADDARSTTSEPTVIADEKSSVSDSPRSSSSSTLAESDAVSDVHHCSLSTLRLWMAHVGAALTLFLATTDATIVSTSLPTIASALQASETEYTWVGVAYMLTQTACQPLYGRISELVGRKCLLYASMIIFVIGSLLCGSAQTITWLIASRAIAGIGGGGIVSSVWVITAEIVEVQDRAKWSQALSVTWSCSAIAGPLLGGLFSTGNSSAAATVSWRWGFYMNLPICLVAYIILWLSLGDVNLGRSYGASWREFGQKFDFIGLVLFMGGTGCIVVGFSFATQNGWSAPSTISLISLGIAVLLLGGIYEVRTTRNALFPASTFKDPTAVIILAITFLHNFAFNAGTFYLALYFQAVNGTTPLAAGMLLLPYSLGSSLASMPAAWFIRFWQTRKGDTSGQKWAICVGLAISTIGFGLLNLLNERSPTAFQAIFPLIAGVGLGMLFHAPYQVFTRALPPHEIATGTSAFFLVRFTGATVGLAVAGAIFYARLSKRMPAEFPLNKGGSLDLATLDSISSDVLKRKVVRIIASSIQTIWAVCTPCLGIAFAISALLHDVPIEEPGDPTTCKLPIQTRRKQKTEIV